MRIRNLSVLTIIPLLMGCAKNVHIHEVIYPFDTVFEIDLYEGNDDDMSEVVSIVNLYNIISDKYHYKGQQCVWNINRAGEVSVDDDLYEMLKVAFSVPAKGAANFDPFLGTLNDKWKEAIKNNTALTQAEIDAELAIRASSTITFNDPHMIVKNGNAEIDLGGFAKGYCLDKVKDYLDGKGLTHYLINGGNSSILLGEKQSKKGLFSVGLLDVENAYLELKNCFVSTSSISNQSTVIDGVVYSHIINPTTGSATPLHDAVIVVSNNGHMGDALSTSMMNSSIEDIKTIESELSVKAIVVNDGKIDYSNPDLEVKYH